MTNDVTQRSAAVRRLPTESIAHFGDATKAHAGTAYCLDIVGTDGRQP